MKKILLSIIIAFFSLVVSQEYNIENCNGNFLITNVSVIKGDGTPPIFDQNVKIKNGIIENIFPFKKGLNIENSYCVINATGKFLSPGFIDSHVHLALGPVSIEVNADVPTFKISHSEELTEISLKLLLESGITTIRDPGGKTTITTSVRSSLENGEFIGPDLVVAGALLDKTNFVNLTRQINSSDDIYDEIDRQLEFNVDWVKLYIGLNPDETKLAIEYAKNKGLKTTAHLDNTTWTEAANAGINNIVHIIPGSERLLPKENRGQYNQSRMTTASFFKWFEYVDLNGPEIREMISALKKNNVSVED